MPVSQSSLRSKAKAVRLIAMDVDGVLTAGDVIVLESGEEVKIWNVKDRLGLALVRKRKIPLLIAWITGRQSKSVTTTAKDLGIHHVIQNCQDKLPALKKIMNKRKLKFNQVAFIGDDLIDLPVLKRVGLSACPADAVPDVKCRVDYVIPGCGGQGVVRTALEYILKVQNKWDPLVKSFLS